MRSCGWPRSNRKQEEEIRADPEEHRVRTQREGALSATPGCPLSLTPAPSCGSQCPSSVPPLALCGLQSRLAHDLSPGTGRAADTLGSRHWRSQTGCARAVPPSSLSLQPGPLTGPRAQGRGRRGQGVRPRARGPSPPPSGLPGPQPYGVHALPPPGTPPGWAPLLSHLTPGDKCRWTRKSEGQASRKSVGQDPEKRVLQALQPRQE